MPHASAPVGGSAVLDTAVVGDSDSGTVPAGLDGNGTGTPNSAAGPGTWSPQWGWYVNMTPPQVSVSSLYLFESWRRMFVRDDGVAGVVVDKTRLHVSQSPLH